ncbi:uncharacterized protein LOC109838185, partial [Asparagus officinalis]|uniref:uncharacterized protein LOC109838185 n=1 Tax=Asparagus officinalis TaxID=4686 RepID=UPI00098E496A
PPLHTLSLDSPKSCFLSLDSLRSIKSIQWEKRKQEEPLKNQPTIKKPSTLHHLQRRRFFSSSSSSSSSEFPEKTQAYTRRPLPQPEAPPGPSKGPLGRPTRLRQIDLSISTIGNFLRHRSSSLSSAITKQISSLTAAASSDDSGSITEFNLSGIRVIVNQRNNSRSQIKCQISFFSRSSCRDSTSIRTFLRQNNLPFVEINLDVFPERENELKERSGSLIVPQIFINEKLLGGVVVFNSLRNSGEFERRLKEIGGVKCPESAPRAPVYGFDDEEEVKRRRVDGLIGIVRVLRQRLPIRDRILRMKMVRNCFSGSEMVEAIILQMDCGRKKAVEIGRELARKHYIHHVFREDNFEDGHNQFYRFLEHDPIIPKCFNFRGATNDDEPKSVSVVGQRLAKLMSALLEAYASDDRRHLDYPRIAASEEFRRYVNLVQDLQRVDIFTLSVDETMAFFLNLYNAMVIHAVSRVERKPGVIDRRAFFNEFQYIVGGYPYSLSTIKNGILRSNRRQPYSFVKPFSANDKRLEVALPKLNPLIHFGLCNGTRSCPAVRFFTAQGVETELRYSAREFFSNGGIDVDLSKRTVYLSKIMKWYDVDFGQEKEKMLKWILNYLDATKAGLLTHLLDDGGPVVIAYQKFDWSLNS